MADCKIRRLDEGEIERSWQIIRPMVTDFLEQNFFRSQGWPEYRILSLLLTGDIKLELINDFQGVCLWHHEYRYLDHGNGVEPIKGMRVFGLGGKSIYELQDALMDHLVNIAKTENLVYIECGGRPGMAKTLMKRHGFEHAYTTVIRWQNVGRRQSDS